MLSRYYLETERKYVALTNRDLKILKKSMKTKQQGKKSYKQQIGNVENVKI